VVSTFETALGTFVVSRSPQARRPLAIYGPTPPAARSPLLLRIRPLYAADRRAVRDGVAREVRGLDQRFDGVAFVETDLDDATVRALLPESAQGTIASAVGKHAAVVQVRPNFVHVEIPPRRKDGVPAGEVPELIAAAAAIAGASRALPQSAVVELHGGGRALVVALIVLALGPIFASVTFDVARLMPPGTALVVACAALASGAVFVVARAAARRLGASRTTSHQIAFERALLAAVALGVAILHLVPIANRALDGEAAAQREATVSALRRTRAGFVGAVCLQSESLPGTCLGLRPPGDDAFEMREVGAPVVIHERRGALRLPWIERIRKAGAGGP